MEVLQSWVIYLPNFLSGFKISLSLTLISLTAGLPLGLLLAISSSSKSKAIRYAAIPIVEIGRGAPTLILLQFAYYGLPSAGLTLTSFTASFLALTIATAAYTSEIMRAALNSVSSHQHEAADVLGLTAHDKLLQVIIPQAVKICIPPLLGFAILILHSTSLCFTIALPELISKAYNQGSNTFDYISVFIMAAVMYATVCIPATLIVNRLEAR